MLLNCLRPLSSAARDLIDEFGSIDAIPEKRLVIETLRHSRTGGGEDIRMTRRRLEHLLERDVRRRAEAASASSTFGVINCAGPSEEMPRVGMVCLDCLKEQIENLLEDR